MLLLRKLKYLCEHDPKPIFDHFRNIGISAALTIGAGALRSFNIEGNPGYINYIAFVCSFIAFTLAMLLLIINTSFAQISINLFFFNKTKFTGRLQKLGSALVMYSYLGVLVALSVMYSINSASDNSSRLNQQSLALERTHMSIEMLIEIIVNLENENIKLQTANTKLSATNAELIVKISQFSASIPADNTPVVD